jgi:flagella basal body P-ring formation protein FlgA
VLAPALLPVRALPAGTVLAAEHLTAGEVDWADDPPPLAGARAAGSPAQAPFTRADQVLGRTLARAWQPGQALRAADLRRRHWFAAGDTVSLLARGSGFAVSGQARALEPGLEGQTARVRLDNGRVLTGRAVGERQVELPL